MPVDSSPVLTLLAREPLPGAAKTRLAPRLGEAGAARLAAVMIDWTLKVARRDWPGPVRLAVWPPNARARFQARYKVPVLAQAGDGLGARMMNVLARQGSPGAVIGCDVPHIDGALLADAAGRLQRGRHVVGPAADGGFYLLGLQHPVAGLFDGIEWSTPNVLARLRENAAGLGVAVDELALMRDIDNPEDLHAVAAEFEPLARYLADSGLEDHG